MSNINRKKREIQMTDLSIMIGGRPFNRQHGGLHHHLANVGCSNFSHKKTKATIYPRYARKRWAREDNKDVTAAILKAILYHNPIWTYNVHIYIYIYIHHHHHHHLALVARISLTLSRHSSLSFIALGRSSGQHPVSSHSC